MPQALEGRTGWVIGSNGCSGFTMPEPISVQTHESDDGQRDCAIGSFVAQTMAKLMCG